MANDISKIRVELSKMNCRVHIKTANITKTGDELHFNTCCDDFKKKLEARFDEMLQEAPVKMVLGR